MSDKSNLWGNIVEQGRLGAVENVQLARAEKTKSKLIKTEVMLFVGIFVSLGLWIAWHLFFIWLQLRPLIKFIDEGRAMAKKASDPSEYYTTSSGFAVAFYYFYPHLNWFSHFRNNAWPTAMLYAYMTDEWGKVMRSDHRNIQKLYNKMDLGNQMSEDTTLKAICDWLNSVGHPTEVCENPCKTFYQPGIGDIMGGAVGGGMMGGFAGHAFGAGGPAALAAIAAGFGLTMWKAASNQRKCNAQTNCRDKKCPIVRVAA